MRRFSIRRPARVAIVIALAWYSPTAVTTGVPAAADQPRLEPIPEPNLDDVESAIVDQLQAQRSTAEQLANAEATDVAALAEEMGKLGQLYILYELLAPADPALANAARLAPSDHRWPYLRATVLQEQRRLDEARQLLETVVDLKADNLPALIRLGDVETAAGDTSAAQAWYRRALDVAPGSPAANWGLGQIAYGEGDSTRAVEHFEAVLEVQPGATAVHYPLGLAYRDLGQVDKARQHLALRGEGRVQPADPLVDGLAALVRGSSLFMVRGNRAFSRGAFDVAVAAYGSAVDADPDNVIAREALASALSRLGRWQQALEQIDWIIENGHAGAGTHYNYGAIHGQQGHVEEATAGYRQALALDPDLIDAHFNLALLLDRAGRSAEAASHFERVLELDPQDTSARVHHASVVATLGRTAEAEEALARVLGVDPTNGEALLALAAVLRASGRSEASLEHYERLIASSKDAESVARAHFEAGGLLLQTGRPEAAVEHLRVAVGMMPNILEARLALATGLARTGRYSEAALEYDLLLSRNSNLVEAHFGRALSLLLAGQDAKALAALERASAQFPGDSQFEHLTARVLAASTDATVRNGDRAVEIASRLFSNQQNVTHAETLAMALAEVGRFDEAGDLQQRIRGEAERTGQGDLGAIDARIDQYQRHEPVRAPWLDGS